MQGESTVAGGHRSDLSGGGMTSPGHMAESRLSLSASPTLGSGLCFTARVHVARLTVSFPLTVLQAPSGSPVHLPPRSLLFFPKTSFQETRGTP